MRKIVKPLVRTVELLATPFVFLSAVLLKLVRKVSVERLPILLWVLEKVGVMPVTRHYYDPMILKSDLRRPLDQERVLRGLNLNTEEQLLMLRRFNFADELRTLPGARKEGEYYIDNRFFDAGDAEYYYSMIRLLKPRRIIEIGSGFSTLVALRALEKNKEEDAASNCELYCIEPYENHWLEKTSANIIRKKVDDVELDFFRALQAGDILFIDSSHVIRPQGDVVTEVLEILPELPVGVYIHIHDIFTPRDYPARWITRWHIYWDEQYLVEAFLMYNSSFKIVGALNYLKHNYFAEAVRCFPLLSARPQSEPASLWLVKTAL